MNEQDILLFEEKDSSSYVDVSRTKDWQYMTININSKTSSEVYLLDAGCPGCLELVEVRRPGVEYFVEHYYGNLLLLTNAPLHLSNIPNQSCDYRLLFCPVGTLNFNNWKNIVLEDHDVITYDMDIFDKHLVLYQRREGLPRVCVLNMPISLDQAKEHFHTPHSYILPLPQGVCSITPGLNQDFYASTLRLSVSSPIMPEALLDFDLTSKDYVVLEQETAGFALSLDKDENGVSENQHNCKIRLKENSVSNKTRDKENWRTLSSKTCKGILDLSALYVCDYVQAQSVDMVNVPLTIVHSRKLKLDGSNPALLMGYGAYGEILDTKWCGDLLSLLDRGWVLAFAHVRGGGELGKSWHQTGKLLQKINSMNDFLACADFLVKNSYAHRHRLAAKGMSAGGLLVAAATNMRPDMFCAVVLKVPFLDICNTMLDESLPLTIPEYEEWGNPNKEEVFQYIQKYSPYDNVKRGVSYPGMLVLSSFLDTRVGYWEAAKWIARVRENAICLADRPALLKTDMDCGHFGEGGRYQHIGDIALEYAFLLKMTGSD